MALTPKDSTHALQIQAGTIGRNKGHAFELELANKINETKKSITKEPIPKYLIYGDCSIPLLKKALSHIGWNTYDSVEAVALGSLATAEEGKKWLEVNGIKVRACKSDILLTFYKDKEILTVGVSVKQCNNTTPTNAQLFFTTATAFCNLLNNNNIKVSESGVLALKQFCGDVGFRPLDNQKDMIGRVSDPRRYFWEEIDKNGREELENIFTESQDKITRLLLQKAYLDDPFIPEILLHKTKKVELGHEDEFALYSIDELIDLSKKYSGFVKKQYSVRKGRYRDPVDVKHEAPRFGIVQMQRGGQQQHPTQLQFNLQASYFYHI